jgi:pyroglutamyl-peptidase
MRRLLLGMLAATATATLVGCTAPGDESGTAPNEGLLRDFLDGKFDAAGHPLNAKVTEAEQLCSASGAASSGAIRLTRACEGPLPFDEQVGDMVASVRVRVRSAPSSGTVVTARILDATRSERAKASLTAAQLRSGDWLDLPLRWSSTGGAVTIQITPSSGAVVDVDYIEVFPSRFGLVASPGSGVYADADRLVLEVPKGRRLERVKLDGVDITARLDTLIQQGRATRTTTEFRTLVDVGVGDLAPERKATSELELRAGSFAARMQLHRQPTPCRYEGDANGVRVLITGFQPFPADGWHENISAVAVTSMDPTTLRGAQVMRVVMPVEYDRAAAQVTDMIARCEPQAVISFGQGGNAIALEQTAYNLQDTGEVSGGVPDNRGIIRAAAQIDPAAPPTRRTLLPLPQIADALQRLGEGSEYSTDPGRYICNNVMFNNIGVMSERGGVGGFIHLPYVTQFDAAERTRWGNVALTAVQATADSIR